ncbi:type II secretion system protein GspL [Marinobacter nanhaiticus D15-8W]|uniref:Type II secretion system protein L n=1 Tax=Marinobacter nanhaiticus D15-8W TaxID=626887 RepID=N6WQR6_9GAMM|nr:type II secretion system protein GspL [Marinobacter nanhaiticus]ENO13926.1 type II secretion system protein GspL [Marinobacter nanhaiticus D15-8W]BES71303.1 type II secretion system protein GspL [Marinobacter nanhaiticus D15-8W]
MSYRLYMQPVPPFGALHGDIEGQRFNWTLIDASGVFQAGGQGDDREVVEQTLTQNDLDHVRLVGLVPGDEALFCFAEIPAKQARYVRQALPFAVEEQIAQDIDSVHLALGERSEQGFRVAAIDRQRTAIWHELFDAVQGADLDSLYPDAALLPVNECRWCICLLGEDTLVAGSRGEWFRMDTANLGIFSHTLASPDENEVVAEISVALYGSEADFETYAGVVSELQQQERLKITKEALEMTPLELLAHSHHNLLCSPINLCQGQFEAVDRSGGLWRLWRPAAVIAGIWFLLQVGVEVGLGYYHLQEARQLEQQAMSIYRGVFPNDRQATPQNVRRVLEGQLRLARQQGPQADFLSLLSQAGAEYDRLGGGQNVQFDSVNYSRQRGELVVELRADSYDRLSSLRSAIGDRGLEARIGSVVNDASGARARLTVSGGAGS